MNKSQRIKIISNILNKHYKTTPVPLNHKDPFTLLIAVLLSAQCTDERVNKVTPILFSKADTPKKMINLSEKEIYKIIKPCGLGPQKSKAILGLSKILIKNYKGRVPKDLEKLEKLPGVGHKTASVVSNQAFGIPTFPVDTHIHRLSQRWGLTKGKNVLQTEKDLKNSFPKVKWGKLHLQMIYWGREFCTARACWGLECKICKSCYPKRKKKFIHKKP
ncbi:MAG: endonuclease III [Pseudomonadota bacterium]|nr:endonuclease III [Pseudomonadota bacterium]MEC7735037.1 endonuclease III [Pseudomonadota bacterium]MEC9382271.1 endonuclease III [Pseudomonadota bacterium]MEC9392685.1 endonuclease III [Pseudomonadota bacterium]MEC9459306.1 endonuclease III [Pseudomonadota bacterium]